MPSAEPKPAARAVPRAVRRIVAVMAVCAAVLAPAWHIHRLGMSKAQADFVPVWVGARVALQGGNPYSEATTEQIQKAYYGRLLRPTDDANKMAFAYPAQTLILFAGFARLPWWLVRATLLALLPLLMLASICLWLLVTGIHLPLRKMALAILLTLGSLPVAWGVHQLQPTVIVALLAALSCFLVQRQYPAAAGFVLALATMKPQLVAPLIAWLGLWTLLRRQWSFLLTFGATTAVLLTAATWLVPGWVGDWRAAMADYVVYRRLHLDLAFFFGPWIAIAIAVALGAAAVYALARNLRCPADSPTFGAMCALALSTTLAVQLTDPSMIYNHVLLLPACLVLVFRKPQTTLAGRIRGFAVAQLVLDFAAAPIAVAAEMVFGPSHFLENLPFMDLLLPTLLTAILIAETLRRRAPVQVLEPRLQSPIPVA